MILVALCFVTVLGISLAGYIAVCSRTMQLSNRTFQTGLSQQLAEMGLEEGLRTVNKNLLNSTDTTAAQADWTNGGTTANWTISGTTATANITFPTGKFGQGVSGSVKVRVDNYAAYNQAASWSPLTTYMINDVVGYNGTWYRCVQNTNLNRTPGVADLAWWVPDPIPWAWNSNIAYVLNNDIICYQGGWLICTTSHTSTSTFDWSKWTWIPAPILAWTANTFYSNRSFVFRTADNIWYRSTSDHYETTWDSSKWTVASWSYQSSVNYLFNDVVSYGGSWYRYIYGTTANNRQPNTNPTYWELALTDSWAWASGVSFNLNDVVYRSGSFYRCILAHATSSTTNRPPNTTYWSPDPLRSPNWESGRYYGLNDTVSYGGVWYRCTTAHSGTTVPSASGNWSSTANSLWNPATAYATSSYASYGGVWYRCIAANTGRAPNNSTYWTALGAPVIYAEGTINLTGSASTKTQLRATIAPAPLFPNAAGANTNTLNISGGGTVDSYNSVTDPNYGSPGFSAVLASQYSAGTAMTISSTTVKGYLAAPSASTTPYAPLYTSGGTVKGTSSPATPNIDLRQVSRSPYVPQFDINIQPMTSMTNLLIPASGTTNIGTPGATTPSIYYYSSALTLTTSDIININGPVILYINGNFRVQATGLLNINPTGSATIYCTGGLRVYPATSNSYGIHNLTKDPKKLTLLSDNTVTTSQYYAYVNSTYPFYGAIYTPTLASTLGLDIQSSAQIYGALSAKEITFSSDANLHYDTSLRYATFTGVDQPFAVTEWRELTDASELATMP